MRKVRRCWILSHIAIAAVMVTQLTCRAPVCRTALQWQMLRLVAVIAIIGGALLVFSFYKLISTTLVLYRKPKDKIKDAAGGGSQDRYKQP
jgi:hypothetical protein